MKLCQTCEQLLAEAMTICPSCGDEVASGRQMIDDYHIESVLQEGHASILCRARKDGEENPVLIRLFKDQSGMNEEMANRLQLRLEKLNSLAGNGIIKHYEIRKSKDDLWYRVSEWVDGEEWSSIFASGMLKDFRIALDLFHQIASILANLHESGHFIPHLVLNDIIPIRINSHRLEVKIDFKLSRFLNHNTQLPGTMLNDLLVCHPDITNNKPLDFRSDIWSLGKIFMELLTADLSGCPSISGIGSLKIPRNAKTLLKLMLAPDPSLRPQSMREVATLLLKLRKEKTEKVRKVFGERKIHPFPEVQKLSTRMWRMAVGFIVILATALLVMFATGVFKEDVESRFQSYANLYSNSVAFVLVEYSLLLNQAPVYRRSTEGTAFLVDEEGYLVTNRHVAAPWLLDRELTQMIQQMRGQGADLSFDYNIYLWFEGQKAYKRIPTLEHSKNLNDIYHLESAYHSHGKPRVEIAGIERALMRQSIQSRSPLKDDFAVLKIDEVPEGLKPIPLDRTMDANRIKKLSPVITIGFPLGSRTQANTVNVSVTKGNVRRTFEDFIQVDTSIYKGNSGGPIIDENGNVIGIATGIVFDTTIGMMPVVTPLSDIGMVLPITKTVTFLSELKAGKTKWKGVMDLSLDKKIEQIKKLALQGEWQNAQDQADNELKFSLEPDLFMTAGMIHLCNGDFYEAKRLFRLSNSIDPRSHEAGFMLYLIDWLDHSHLANQQRRSLLELDWRSQAEFFGFLTNMLEGKISTTNALTGWQNDNEKSWIYYISALIHLRQKEKTIAEELLKNSALHADKENWVLYLALAELNRQHSQQIILAHREKDKQKLKDENDKFYKDLADNQLARLARDENIKPLYSRVLNPAIRITDRLDIIKKILELNPDNKELMVSLIFLASMDDEWELATQQIDQFFRMGGRENKSYLGVKMLELGIAHLISSDQQALTAHISSTVNKIQNPWFKEIVHVLSNKKREGELIEHALEHPEMLLSAHFALGFWAEGGNNLDKAIEHYKQVLSTYLEGWWEYEFAKYRIRKLRLVQENSSLED